MTGEDFVRAFAKRGYRAWEAAALDLARRGQLTPWPFVDLPLRDEAGNTAVLKVRSDVLSVGPIGRHLRLPLTPSSAQSILNLTGELLPTPWIVYQTWRAAPIKVSPLKRVPTARLEDFAEHSAAIDRELSRLGAHPGQLTSGLKKDVVVSNIHQPDKVLIHGWYKPPPAPDVFDDGRDWRDPERQPQQVRSNAHGAFYFDYSHGIRGVGPVAIVNGRPMRTEDLYRHPTLSRLVSNEPGPLRVVRYPSPVPPTEPEGVPSVASEERASRGVIAVPTTPRLTLASLAKLGQSGDEPR